jgi:hypothetical protein
MYDKGTQAGRYSRGKKFKKSNTDDWFSKFIRIRDIKTGEHCMCITCGKFEHWKDMDCGHFMLRDRPLTRFHEQNCNAQCKRCNRFRDGEQYRHGKAIDEKYGKGTADKLEELAKFRGKKHTPEDLKELSKEYRIKAKEMAKKKGIEL